MSGRKFRAVDILSFMCENPAMSPRGQAAWQEIMTYMHGGPVPVREYAYWLGCCQAEIVVAYRDLAEAVFSTQPAKRDRHWVAAQVRRFGQELVLKPIPR